LSKPLPRFFGSGASNAWVNSQDAGNINFMANEWDENKSEESNDSAQTGATPAGMVEAVTQNVELIVDKVMDTAEDAVVAVQEKLGMRRPAPRAKKPAKPKPKAKAPAVKAKAPTAKMKAPATKAKVSKAAKAKPRMVAKTIPRKVAKSAKRVAKPTRASKGKKTGRKR
jgi:hypothetical protein